MCQELRPENERALKQLVGNLQTCRNSLASNVRHPLDRTQAERWMQMLDLPRYGYFMEIIRVRVGEGSRRGLRVMFRQ